GVQSVKMKEPGLTGMYYDYALAAPVMAGIPEKGLAELTGRRPGRVLVLGNGTGTYATLCAEYFETAEIEGVEIDEKISDLAYEYFDMSEDVKLTTYDGRAYLQAAEGKYDVILVDAYQDITIPFQMSSVEFFSLVKDHLTDNGVMVVNMNMHSDGEGSINEALADTISSVFSSVYTVDVRNNTNRELFAADFDVSKALMDNNVIRDISQVSGMAGIVYSGLVSYEAGGNILTDDRAPVEVLGMRAIDELISDELGYYKTLFKEEGIKGVMSLL
ncbi:MAG: fused MFS/spermidine synthase, partial [Firmicutes bacterium]|nr:fused MFS/spermidine synthase [Bacillota bacterium]